MARVFKFDELGGPEVLKVEDLSIHVERGAGRQDRCQSGSLKPADGH